MVIDVLGLYTTELVNRRGSALAVQTEFVHLLDVGNEAYAASGANVRFRFVAFHETNYAIGPNKDNDVALNDIRINNLPDLDLHAARDALRAWMRNQNRWRAGALTGYYSSGCVCFSSRMHCFKVFGCRLIMT